MSKPDFPLWARAEVAGQIETPVTAKIDQGWDYLEKPAFEFMNYLAHNAGKFFVGLQGGFHDIVVGSSAQVTSGVATHTVSNFVAAVAANDKVLILEGTHTLVRNEDITEAGVRLYGETPAAILAFSTFTFTMSGVNSIFDAQTSGVGSNDLIITGAGSHLISPTISRASVQLAAGVSALTGGSTGFMAIPGGGSEAFPSLVFGSDQDTGGHSPGADQLAWSTGGVTAFSLDASQNATFAAALNVTGVVALTTYMTFVSNETDFPSVGSLPAIYSSNAGGAGNPFDANGNLVLQGRAIAASATQQGIVFVAGSPSVVVGYINENSFEATGGIINTAIGATGPSTGAFTTLSATGVVALTSYMTFANNETDFPSVGSLPVIYSSNAGGTGNPFDGNGNLVLQSRTVTASATQQGIVFVAGSPSAVVGYISELGLAVISGSFTLSAASGAFIDLTGIGSSSAGNTRAYRSATLGLVLVGQGSSNDVSILNDLGNENIALPTGTRNVNLGGAVAGSVVSVLGTDAGSSSGGALQITGGVQISKNMWLAADAHIAMGSSDPTTGIGFYHRPSFGADATQEGMRINPLYNSSGTTALYGIRLIMTTIAGVAVSDVYGVYVTSLVVPATSTVNRGHGFLVGNPSVSGTLSNYFGFRSDVVSGSNRWAFYGAGTAASFFGGDVTLVGQIINPRWGVLNTASDATAGAQNEAVLLCSDTTDQTITLTANMPVGTFFHIKKIGATGNLIITSTDDIDGSSSDVILSQQHSAVTAVSDGSNWHII